MFDLSLNKYIKKEEKTSASNMDQTSVNLRIENLYIEEIKKDISKQVEELGFEVNKCEIKAQLDANGKNPGIHNINLVLSKNSKSNIDKVEINIKNEYLENSQEEVGLIKEKLAKHYEISPNIIDLKIKGGK